LLFHAEFFIHFEAFSLYALFFTGFFLALLLQFLLFTALLFLHLLFQHVLELLLLVFLSLFVKIVECTEAQAGPATWGIPAGCLLGR
jgi:hypothetical protein